jgi:hypothetical protein
MRIGCFLPLIAIGLLIGGGQGIYTAVTNPKPKEIGIDEVAQQKPDAKWLRITGGVLDNANSAYTSAFGVGEASQVYIPLVGRTQDSTKLPIHVLVLTKDPDLVKFTNDSRKLEKSGSTDAATKEFLLKNFERLRVARDVEGVVQFGISSGGKEESKIRALYQNLADDALILEEGEKPSVLASILMMAGGLLVGGFLVMSSMRKAKAA